MLCGGDGWAGLSSYLGGGRQLFRSPLVSSFLSALRTLPTLYYSSQSSDPTAFPLVLSGKPKLFFTEKTRTSGSNCRAPLQPFPSAGFSRRLPGCLPLCLCSPRSHDECPPCPKPSVCASDPPLPHRSSFELATWAAGPYLSCRPQLQGSLSVLKTINNTPPPDPDLWPPWGLPFTSPSGFSKLFTLCLQAHLPFASQSNITFLNYKNYMLIVEMLGDNEPQHENANLWGCHALE